MAKRTATYQLTAENFDAQEEEAEVQTKAGEFSKASDDVMARRVIKKAKKRIDGSEASSGNPVNIFSGFKSSAQSNGISSMNSVTSDNPPMASSIFKTTGFGLPTQGLEASTTPTLLNRVESKPSTSDISLKMMNQNNEKAQTSGSLKDSTVKSDKNITDKDGQKEKDVIYGDQIAALNMSFLNWINAHVEKNPVVDLTPVFKDYTKYMDDIEFKYGKSSRVEENAASAAASARIGLENLPGTSSASPSIFGKSDEGNSKDVSSPFAGFNQSKTSDPPLKANTAGFFDASQASTPAVPEATSNVTSREEHKGEDGEEESNDTNMAERKTVIEEDAFYTTRCKLFFKKVNDWTELGVGMLYLKSLSDGKTQLLVRMETAAGKVLLNISLHKNLPVARVGKNNVSVISVPNPPVFLKEKDGDNSKPLNYLIRVKEREDADELLKKINDNK